MDIESQLETFVSNHEEITQEEAEELYSEQLEEVQERATDAIPEERVEKLAYRQFRSEFNKSQSVEQDSEGMDIISIGHSGIQNWKSGDTLLAYGVANPDDGPANTAVFIIDEEDVPLQETKEMFEPMASLKGNFSLSESDSVPDLYVCNSTSDTEVLESDMDMSESERHEWVNDNHVSERATLDSIVDHLSMTNDQGYASDFGGDLKRMQATVMNFYIPDDWSFGVLTLQDESVLNPLEELDEEVIGDAEGNRDVGLTAWIDPEMITFGEYSVMDFYGNLTRNDDGQIQFNVVGAVPIMPTEPDFSNIGSSNDDVDDSATEETSI